MDYLARESADLPVELWNRIDDAVIGTARKHLTCRRFLKLFGPLGPGATSVADRRRGEGRGAGRRHRAHRRPHPVGTADVLRGLHAVGSRPRARRPDRHRPRFGSRRGRREEERAPRRRPDPERQQGAWHRRPPDRQGLVEDQEGRLGSGRARLRRRGRRRGAAGEDRLPWPLRARRFAGLVP